MTNGKYPDTVALIVAAGRGRRISGNTPKQYLSIGKETILSRTARIFIDHPEIDAVRIVIHPDDQELYETATRDLNLLEPVYGGKERQASVRNGLESLVSLGPSIVLIHDSVRPFVSSSIIDNVLKKVRRGKSCVPGIPLSDALKFVNEGNVVKNLDRKNLWRIQTPQGFLYDQILKAHQSLIDHNLPDDASVAEAYGLSVAIIKGSRDNEKITSSDDLEYAMDKFTPQFPDIRVGNGYDVHPFSVGDYVTICGIKIPYKKALDGHSDADVGFHALTDAILGALGKGDIGESFPSSDEQWKNANSQVFLEHAGECVGAMNAIIMNLDITIICEAPKIVSFRKQMIIKISTILNISPSRVNVKGKTNDKLGFIGREEGIAAHANATILME